MERCNVRQGRSSGSASCVNVKKASLPDKDWRISELFIASTIIAIVMSLLLVFSGVGKLRHDPRQVHTIHEVVGVPMRWFPWLAACEFAGAAGLLVGIVWWPLGIAAAVGVIAYFVGAIVAHVRVRDFKGLTGPALLLLFAVAVLVTRILSL